jgi:hypothetical protein
MGDFSTLDPK